MIVRFQNVLTGLAIFTGACLSGGLAVAGDQAKTNEIKNAEHAVDLALAATKYDPPRIAKAAHELALKYLSHEQFKIAEDVFKEALGIQVSALGTAHHDTAVTRNHLALLYRKRGKYDKVKDILKTALSVYDADPTYDQDDKLLTLDILTGLYRHHLKEFIAAGRYAREALSIRERRYGKSHIKTVDNRVSIALLYRDQGLYWKAEPLLKSALASFEGMSAPDSRKVVRALSVLGGLYRLQGLYTDAEPHLKRAVNIESTKHFGDSRHATALNNLALLYSDQRRFSEAKKLFLRVLSIEERKRGTSSIELVSTLDALAGLARRQSHPDVAMPYLVRALAIRKENPKSDRSLVAKSMRNLARIFLMQKRHNAADNLFAKAELIYTKALGVDHPATVANEEEWARGFIHQGRYAEAKTRLLHVIKVRKKILGLDHPGTANAIHLLGRSHYRQKDWKSATKYFAESTSILVRRASLLNQASSSTSGSATSTSPFERDAIKFTDYVRAAFKLGTPAARSQAFLIAQRALTNNAAKAVARMSTRFQSGDGQLMKLIRERQDLQNEWREKDRLLVVSLSKPNAQELQADQIAQRSGLTAIEERLEFLRSQQQQKYPDYTALANPEVLSIKVLQNHLRDDEVLVQYLVSSELQSTPEATIVWVITKTQSQWFSSNLGTKALTRHVTALRCGLDYTFWRKAEHWDAVDRRQKFEKSRQITRRKHCQKLIGHEPQYDEHGEARPETLPFDAARAHQLYKSLLGRAEDLIKGKHLLVVPAGPLTALPFHVLITQEPSHKMLTQASEYRAMDWLALQPRQPITVLPSVASLVALRQRTKSRRAANTYFGLANPLLVGTSLKHKIGAEEASRIKTCSDTRSRPNRIKTASRRSLAGFEGLYKSARRIDIESVRQWSPLPETAQEACRVAHSLGASEDNILLGARATENNVKSLSENGTLALARIIHFATHGALTGQVAGVGEPGLILTPPPRGTVNPEHLFRNDGFLSATEIARLKLNADLVILSACNTAAGQKSNEEPLSGLARAFFYAGARALLVSHWEVGSNAAVMLVSGAISKMTETRRSGNPIGRSEALRAAMVKLILEAPDWAAHPSAWASFVVVGEGSY